MSDQKHPLHDSYPSVVNLSNPQQVEIFCNEFPELKDCPWTIEEKYHGFNFQATFLPDSELGYEPDYCGSREMQVTRETKFYGAWATIDRFSDQFAKLRDFARSVGSKLTVYMEIFGGKVSHGIHYNIPEGQYKLRFLGAKLDDVFLSPYEFYKLMSTCNIPDNLVALPVATVMGIDEAIAFDPVFHSSECVVGDGSDNDRSFAEGIVAKPLYKHFVNKGGKSILIKKKHPRFQEYQTEKVVREVNPEVEKLREVFKGFLNANRIDSALSKLGPITSKKQIAQYLRYITEDAKKDFLEQYGETFSQLSGDDQKSALNVGSYVANQLLQLIESSAA